MRKALQKVKVLLGSKKAASRGKVRCRFFSLLLLLGTAAVVSGGGPEKNVEEQRLDAVVKEFQARINIPEQVSASIVEANEHLVSVEHFPRAR